MSVGIAEEWRKALAENTSLRRELQTRDQTILLLQQEVNRLLLILQIRKQLEDEQAKKVIQLQQEVNRLLLILQSRKELEPEP